MYKDLFSRNISNKMIGASNDTTFYDLFGDEDDEVFYDFPHTSNELEQPVCHDGKDNIDIHSYTQSVQQCMGFLYFFYILFLFVSFMYETKRQKREREVKEIEEYIQDEIYIIRREMEKFKKNMKKIRKNNKKIYKIQKKIKDLEDLD